MVRSAFENLLRSLNSVCSVYRIYLFLSIIFELFISLIQVFHFYKKCVLFLCLPLNFSPVLNIKTSSSPCTVSYFYLYFSHFSSLFNIISLASLIFHSISVVCVQHICPYYIVQTECAVIINNTWNHALIKHLC